MSQPTDLPHPTDWGSIATWFGVVISLGLGIVNFFSNRGRARADRFNAAFGDDISGVVSSLREVKSGCDSVLKSATSVDAAREQLEKTIHPSLVTAESRLTFEVGRLKNTHLARFPAQWRQLVGGDIWDPIWSQYENARVAQNLGAVVSTVAALRDAAASVHDRVLDLRDKEIS